MCDPCAATKDTRHTKVIICCHVAPLTTRRTTMAGQGPLIMVKSNISLSGPTARALALVSSWLGWQGLLQLSRAGP